MWTTLALMTALSGTPAQAGQLDFKNVRVTYGILGQERKDTTFLPGDLYVLAFDIEGLKVAEDGGVKYSMSMELTDKAGKTQFKKDPNEMVTGNTLGGSRLPAFALTEIGVDTPPGEYKMTVIVTDGVTKATGKLERTFEVKAPRFGIVRPGFTYNNLNERQVGQPQIAPPLAVPGQNLLLNFAVVGFDLKGEMQNPNLEVKIDVKDANGQGVKPYTIPATSIEDEFKKLKVFPFAFPIQLNRSGKFTIAITATDKHTSKTATMTLDLRVVDLNP
jgi:hypothetical protein